MNRSPNGINVHRFLEGYGVKVLPYHLKRDPRPANVVYGGRQVARLMRKDIDRTGLTVRCIQASNPTCFEDIYLLSVYRFLGVHLPQSAPRDAINAFSGIDIALVKQNALHLSIGVGGALAKSTAAISIELARAIILRDKAA
ncbi:hypothetical protein RMR10_011990 [Agrobacterium rosae]|uniref:hypothetical protein n=1 Tax=Agrobacterium rosae TaxID=1972867 RepID=UPI002A0E59F4|nr:hypothetical protein [Agrobacterium rosae]MDX8313348.1 hypothetical protein [Agrobacterium rosae]